MSLSRETSASGSIHLAAIGNSRPGPRRATPVRPEERDRRRINAHLRRNGSADANDIADTVGDREHRFDTLLVGFHLDLELGTPIVDELDTVHAEIRGRVLSARNLEIQFDALRPEVRPFERRRRRFREKDRNGALEIRAVRLENAVQADLRRAYPRDRRSRSKNHRGPRVTARGRTGAREGPVLRGRGREYPHRWSHPPSCPRRSDCFNASLSPAASRERRSGKRLPSAPTDETVATARLSRICGVTIPAGARTAALARVVSTSTSTVNSGTE